MKNLYFSLSLCSFSLMSFGQIVNIPDINFKNRLLNTNCAQLTSPAWPTDVDTNNDDQIQVSEAANVLKLDVSTNEFNSTGNIMTLDGLESFSNITDLNCKGNSLLNMDVTSFSNLVSLDCSYNQLTNINVSGLTNLMNLICSKNQLTQLNVTGLTNLKLIYCIYNNLTQVDISGLTALENFQCDVNQISNLTLGNNEALELLSVSKNLLTTIDLQSTPNLYYLWAAENAITDINLNGLSNLDSIEIYTNSLTAIDASQATHLNRLHCSNNPNLTTINVRNNYVSFGDPDLLDFPFRFEDLPNITSICVDEGEQNFVLSTLYNPNIIFGGPNCDVLMGVTSNTIEDTIVLYPNPAKNTINIDVVSGVIIQSISVYNPLGQLIKTLTANEINASLAIDVTALKTGTYFMEINSNQGKTTKKFIKL